MAHIESLNEKINWLVGQIKADKNVVGRPPVYAVLENRFKEAGFGDDEEFERVMDVAKANGLVKHSG